MPAAATAAGAFISKSHFLISSSVRFFKIVITVVGVELGRELWNL